MRATQETDHQFLRETGFQGVVSYRDVSHAPPVVAQATHQNLDLYLGNVVPDMGPIREYFAGHTLSFVHAAEKGFIRDFRKIGKAFIEEADLQVLLGKARPYSQNSDVEDTEAFGYSLVVFSVLQSLLVLNMFQLVLQDGEVYLNRHLPPWSFWKDFKNLEEK